jgi:hypothetical protein
MEKMDSERRCFHVKVFSLIQPTNEFKMVEAPWICKLCGAEGADVVSQPPPVEMSYSQLMSKKARGGFGRSAR